MYIRPEFGTEYAVGRHRIIKCFRIFSCPKQLARAIYEDHEEEKFILLTPYEKALVKAENEHFIKRFIKIMVLYLAITLRLHASKSISEHVKSMGNEDYSGNLNRRMIVFERNHAIEVGREPAIERHLPNTNIAPIDQYICCITRTSLESVPKFEVFH